VIVSMLARSCKISVLVKSEVVVLKILILKLANKRRSQSGPTTVDWKSQRSSDPQSEWPWSVLH